MKKFFAKLGELPYRLAAAAAVAAMTVSEQAHAQTGIGTVANNVDQQFNSLGKVVVGGAFLGGIGLSGAGLLKLKQAADSGGQQVKYGEGLWRLGVGAGLASLPVVTNTGVGTLFNGDSSAPTETAITIQ
jgi:hypothetical protein